MKRSFFIALLTLAGFSTFFLSDKAFSQMEEMKNKTVKKMKMQEHPTSSKHLRPEGQVSVKLTAHQQNIVGVKTHPVRHGFMTKVIHSFGRVTYNERTLTTVTTKIEGWIEDLSVNAHGMAVKKGDPLFSVYSPKLVQTQEEYLLAFKAQKSKANKTRRNLVSASRRRLMLWDVTETQLRALEKRGKLIRALPVLSPASGIVTEKMALNGMYVKPGMPLYQIADLSKIWILVDIYEHELPWLQTGQIAELTLSALPGQHFRGKVDHIYPYLNEDSRTATLRIELDNQVGKFKPGMVADITFSLKAEKALLIPESALLDSGRLQVAFVALAGGLFEPRVIKVGRRLNHEVEVLSGLSEGESVVTHGTFLIDSESKLNASMDGMMGLVGMGDWQMEGSKMGGMEMDGMEMGDSPSGKMKEMKMQNMPEMNHD